MTTPVTSTIISASAGTGKTYRLSVRFIALLALGVDPLAMVALTFTRKAAAEFRSRILRDLADAAADEQAASRLADAIHNAWAGDEEGEIPLCPHVDPDFVPLTAGTFLQLLRKMVLVLSRLQLSTLDSFFNTLVSLSRLELGKGDMQLLTGGGEEAAKQRALQALFAWVNQDEDAAEAFLHLFMEYSGDKNLNMQETLIDIYDRSRELFLSPRSGEPWGNWRAFGILYNPDARVLTEEEMHAKQEEINRLAPDAGIPKSAITAFSKLEGKLSIPTFSGYTAANKVMAAPGDNPNAQRIAALALEMEASAMQKAINECIVKSKATELLMTQYEANYRSQINGRGQYSFSDVTRLVPGLLEKDGMASRLAYRLDSHVQHWMLDEFQDTSVPQWAGLTPLLEEIATEAGAAPQKTATRSLFVVGDTKQSIYGWRGGTPSLFRYLQEEQPWCAALQGMEMSRSWRSSQTVLDFVNALFGFTGGLLHTAAKERAGYVRVTRIPGENSAEHKEAMYAAIGDLLVEELDFPNRNISVGILVRSNSEVEDIVSYLQANRPGLKVRNFSKVTAAVNSPLGEVLLAFFRWLMHPGDAYRHAEITTSPLGAILTEDGRDWNYWRKALEQGGYGALLERVQSKLAGSLSDYHAGQMQLWVAEAAGFDAAGGGSLSAWLDYMESLTRQDSPPKSYVHVMTIHASKGLEYDAVILPYGVQTGANKFDNTKHLHYLTNLSDDRRLTGILYPPVKEVRDRIPQFVSAVQRWEADQRAEARNLMYVALTRAARANYIFLPQNAKMSEGPLEAECYATGLILRGVANAGGDAQSTFGVVYESGTQDWHLDAGGRPAPMPAPAPAPLGKAVRRRTPKHPSSTTDFSQTEDAGTPEEADSREAAMDFGTQVHACFEQVLDLNSFPAPVWLASPRTAAQHRVAQALAVPEIAALFALPPGVEAYNEIPLEAVDAKTWTSAVIDRLLVYPDGTAHIIDYKTTSHTEGLVEKYSGQMSAYRALVSRALGIPQEAIRVTLISINDHPQLWEC